MKNQQYRYDTRNQFIIFTDFRYQSVKIIRKNRLRLFLASVRRSFSYRGTPELVLFQRARNNQTLCSI